jgi:UTP--glucose-1-phosphate uridylyltransferase
MKAVIPAAGLGTRFLPYTKAQPKEMLPVVDKPCIQYVVEEAAESGIRDILIVTGRGKKAIEDHFDANIELESHLGRSGRSSALEDLRRLMEATRIMYVRQPQPLGLGDALRHAEPFAHGQPFAVLLGDDITFDPPCIRVLREVHDRLGGSVIALQRVPRDRIGRYGMIAGREAEKDVVLVEDVVEKPRPEEIRSDLAAIGRYIFTPRLFGCLRGLKPGKNGEIQLADAVKALCAEEKVHGVIYDGTRYDIGDKVDWMQATLELAAKRADLADGVREMLRDFKARGPP